MPYIIVIPDNTPSADVYTVPAIIKYDSTVAPRVGEFIDTLEPAVAPAS